MPAPEAMTARDEQMQLLFGTLLPAGVAMFSCKDVALLFDVHPRSIANAFDAGKLPGYGLKFSGDGDYETKRIPRWAVLQWMIKHASFDAATLYASLDDLAETISQPMLVHLHQATAARLKRLKL